MRRRHFLKALGMGFAATCAGRTLAKPTDTEKPNIVLCMADDQGWGDMGYTGHPAIQTPHFDAMAADGLRFDRFYAAAPVCSPTRGSVMTGRHPNRFGCFKWGHTLRTKETTIAEALKQAGYVTGHFGKWHLGSVRRGSPVNPGASGFDAWLSAPNFFDNDPILSREGTAVQTRGESSMVTVDAAIDFMRKHAGGPKPFLAVVWFGSPHGPHKAAPEDRALYAGQPRGMQDFCGEITGMDRAFGKLRRTIRELGVRDNTILWYCSDNGGLKQPSTGGRAKKGSIYEGGLRVPAMLEWPTRISAPARTAVPCNTSDIYPTLLAITGTTVPRQVPLDGIDLSPLLDGKMNKRPKPIGFWDYSASGIRTPSAEWMAELLEAQKTGNATGNPARIRKDAGQVDKQYREDTFPGHAAWLDWPWKLHRIEKGTVKIELYNLANDPMEKQNLAGKDAPRVKRMRSELDTWLLSVVRSLNGKDYR